VDEREAEYHGILFFAGVVDGEPGVGILVTLEKTTDLARELGVYIDAVLAGSDEAAQELIAYGANKVLSIKVPGYDTQELLGALTAIVKSRKPEVVVFPDGFAARDLGPRLAQRFGTSFVPSCTSLTVEERERKVIQTRRIFGGKVAVRVITTVAAPQFLSVEVDMTMEPMKADYPRGEVIEWTGQ
jgi:electron transfer flavoprotein alpha subunit